MPVNSALPSEKFLEREIIALAGVLDAQRATAHRVDDDSLASGYPALGVGRRQFEGRNAGPETRLLEDVGGIVARVVLCRPCIEC